MILILFILMTIPIMGIITSIMFFTEDMKDEGIISVISTIIAVILIVCWYILVT